MTDWVDVEIVGKDIGDTDEPIYIQQHRISENETKIEIQLDQKPYRIIIDPEFKLMGQKVEDNIWVF